MSRGEREILVVIEPPSDKNMNFRWWKELTSLRSWKAVKGEYGFN